ncbi:class I SAM-dependent methyltransferase [Pseudomonas entomophila]|uniref:class I SAM-dependent methyltransferase n=1 Tax=Pseudomonas entomophila TaxID=312306 RepID=UPI0023D81CC7|nr:class I SAM-dependent methyltransferase [Pseudomonas entomophila]MDF0733675.1 class I SAM-dependent methyltransferase [Pseudomonas entomophila]
MSAQLRVPVGPQLNELFLLRVAGVEYLGYKPADLDGRRLGSRLTPRMMLGVLLDSSLTAQHLTCRYRPLSLRCRQAVFSQALASAHNRIHFPFPVLDQSARELTVPDGYWEDTLYLADRLDEQEAHFRNVCRTTLSKHLQANALIHDPACSTGTFIGTLARALPQARCLGADRCAPMISHATRHHQRHNLHFTVADANQPALPAASCDVLILRFLNAEMMLRREAVALFHGLCRLVKPGGMIILFGHTPVLFEVEVEARRQGLQVAGSLGSVLGTDELFQFYRLRRT